MRESYGSDPARRVFEVLYWASEVTHSQQSDQARLGLRSAIIERKTATSLRANLLFLSTSTQFLSLFSLFTADSFKVHEGKKEAKWTK